MPNRVVIFPANKQTEAKAYREWADQHSPFAPEPFAYLRNDTAGRWVVPYLGPPFVWDGVEFPEPEGGEVMRAGGARSDTVTWSEEEDASP
tara:strand:- start:5035 stop:5307 length:273 start_codon:yes stop_codon:yes gene_type:complete